jgi:tetratricopeptide (TPR) repeat protein
MARRTGEQRLGNYAVDGRLLRALASARLEAQPVPATGEQAGMAKLFLSYSRNDVAKAQRITRWLEHEGHEVWRDEDDIGGGASFSGEIERALKDCDAVLALWSVSSVQSAWVRDEAGFGRDANKLIPFALDGTEPPLGFRQFQSIDLSRWKRHGEPSNADRIRSAITRVAGPPQAAPSPVSAPNRRHSKTIWRRPMLAGGAIVLSVAVGLALFQWQHWWGVHQVTIAVLASPESSDKAMAADYASVVAADMAAFLPRRFDRATVIAPRDATPRMSSYRMQISTASHGAGANATLTLSDEDGHTILWSRNWSVADASGADLKAQVSESASKAALCLTDARGGSRRLSQPALGLFLTGCADLGDTKLSSAEFETIFERVTKLVPDFPPAWNYLALSQSWIAQGLNDSSPAAYAAAVQRARQTIAVARKLNPNSAVPYDAEFHLISNNRFRGLQVLEKAAAIDPDDPRIQMHLSEAFMSVGRMSDSVQAAERSIELAPSEPYGRSQYIVSLANAGEFSKAKAEIADARKKWPNDQQIDLVDFGYQLRYGDPRAALYLLPRIGDLSDADMVPVRKVIAARIEPTPAKIDDAIAALNARWGGNPRTRGNVFRALGGFGRVDEAYQLLQDREFQPFVEIDVLFRPDFAGVRADPRFMQVAARLGLVRYWRQTGYWPDFCTSEKLAYDCKTEAAKYL